MKKLKNGIIAFALLSGITFMLQSNQAQAQILEDPDGDVWVCCKSKSIGCVTVNGWYFASDYKYFGSTCPGAEQD